MATMSPPTTQDPRWGNVVISATPDELRAVKPFLRSLRLLAIELVIVLGVFASGVAVYTAYRRASVTPREAASHRPPRLPPITQLTKPIIDEIIVCVALAYGFIYLLRLMGGRREVLRCTRDSLGIASIDFGVE